MDKKVKLLLEDNEICCIYQYLEKLQDNMNISISTIPDNELASYVQADKFEDINSIILIGLAYSDVNEIELVKPYYFFEKDMSTMDPLHIYNHQEFNFEDKCLCLSGDSIFNSQMEYLYLHKSKFFMYDKTGYAIKAICHKKEIPFECIKIVLPREDYKVLFKNNVKSIEDYFLKNKDKIINMIQDFYVYISHIERDIISVR